MSSDENEKLNELLESGTTYRTPGINLMSGNSNNSTPQPAYPTVHPTSNNVLDLCQWQVGANGIYRGASQTVRSIPAGSYTCYSDDRGWFIKQHPTQSDNLLELPETANTRVLESIRKFWRSADRYRRHGLLHKRGVLLWGPPGSGKTATVQLCTRDLIADGGIVLFNDCSPDLMIAVLLGLRTIEPSRPLIVVHEDLDEIIDRHTEHGILAMLDGEHQVANVVHIATTNYPEKLGARIVNRPSRFDERIRVDMPTRAARVEYLTQVLTIAGDEQAAERANKWADDTDRLSIAHLRELVAAVFCLEQSYEDVLQRLRSMTERPRESNSGGFGERPVGMTVGLGPMK